LQWDECWQPAGFDHQHGWKDYGLCGLLAGFFSLLFYLGLSMQRLSVKAVLVVSVIGMMALVSCKSDTPASNNNNNQNTGPDSVLYTFAVTGCNRLDKADTNTTANPSTANVAELNRMFSDLPLLNPKPKYFFFLGDMVIAKSDSAHLRKQLTAWRQIYEASPMPASGITLVPVMGNHESNDGQVGNASLENVWLSVMAHYIFGNNGPKVGGPDDESTDQSKLSFSFDYQDSHFIAVNTDAPNHGYQAPTHWVASDIATARANVNTKHIFVLAHKPAYSFDYAIGGTDGLGMYPALRDSFWAVLTSNKVEAMFSAHNHLMRRVQPTNNTWMVIAGDGGTILSGSAAPNEEYYGYVLVSVMKSGKVIVRSIGHDTPAGGYTAPCPAASYPGTVRDSVDISWKN
jgi:hypothetical protein